MLSERSRKDKNARPKRYYHWDPFLPDQAGSRSVLRALKIYLVMENNTLLPQGLTDSKGYIADARKTLWERYRRVGTWRGLADELELNVYYVYRFVMQGDVPGNPEVALALGLKVCPLCGAVRKMA